MENRVKKREKRKNRKAKINEEENVENTFGHADQDHTVYLFSNIY